MKIKRNQKGFTLIEVVLVLAIGGLIFLLAFIAFQQVSTNRRDTSRRADAGRVVAELANAEADGLTVNSVANAATFVTRYLGGTSGTTFTSNNITYTVTYTATAPAVSTSSSASAMSISKGTCNGTAISGSTTANTYAVAVGLEKGVACRDDD